MKPAQLVRRIIAGKQGEVAVLSLQLYRNKTSPEKRNDLNQLLEVIKGLKVLDEDSKEFWDASKEAIEYSGKVARIILRWSSKKKKKKIQERMQTLSPANYHVEDVIDVLHCLHLSRTLQTNYLKKAVPTLKSADLSEWTTPRIVCILAVILKKHLLPMQWILPQLDLHETDIETFHKLGFDVIEALKRNGLGTLGNNELEKNLRLAITDPSLWRCFEEHAAAYGLKSNSSRSLASIMEICKQSKAETSVLYKISEKRLRESNSSNMPESKMMELLAHGYAGPLSPMRGGRGGRIHQQSDLPKRESQKGLVNLGWQIKSEKYGKRCYGDSCSAEVPRGKIVRHGRRTQPLKVIPTSPDKSFFDVLSPSASHRGRLCHPKPATNIWPADQNSSLEPTHNLSHFSQNRAKINLIS